MAFPPSIKLEVAREIFEGVTFEEMKIGDKTVGYRAIYKGEQHEAATLKALCLGLWRSYTR